MNISELLTLSEFFLDRSAGRVTGHLRIPPSARPEAKTLAQMLERLNRCCGRENVWFHHSISGWTVFRWIGGSEKFHRSLARRCRPSNLSSQRQKTEEILASYAEPPKPLAERTTEELRELARAAIGQLDRSTLLKMLGQPQAEKTQVEEKPEPIESNPPERSDKPDQFDQPERSEPPTDKPLTQMTVKELVQVAKARKLRGYSRMRKAELLASLQAPDSSVQPQTTSVPNRITRESLSTLTIRQLQNFARGKGIKNYWRLRKSDLIERLLDWDFNQRFDRALPIAHNVLNPYRAA